ncbi:hypothetical protein DL769_004240 [Monosporascus sp. CRB-8-3]|nr:hypothetical protein DL769_004240 [Monosporascus sp. CRB-8-3]
METLKGLCSTDQLELLDCVDSLRLQETKHQSPSDVGIVQTVVKHYMKQPKSGILAVISAKNDCANQIVLNLARSVDPTEIGKINVITKSDTLHPSSGSEKPFLLAKNREVKFHLGWHVLKNLDSEKGFVLLQNRNREEARFFQEPKNPLQISQDSQTLAKSAIDGSFTAPFFKSADSLARYGRQCVTGDELPENPDNGLDVPDQLSRERVYRSRPAPHQ